MDGSGNVVPTTTFQTYSPLTTALYHRHINQKGVFAANEGYVSSTKGSWDTPTGTLRSPQFTVAGDIIEFYIGGGGNANLALQLWVDMQNNGTFTLQRESRHAVTNQDVEFDYDFWAIGQANSPNLRENWVIMILPFLEQQSLHDKFNLSLPITNPANEPARSVRLAVMSCPVDSYNRRPFNGSTSSVTNQQGDHWARGNYAANAALGFMTYQRGQSVSGGLADAAFMDSTGWASPKIRGVMGANSSVGIAGIRDGTSNTALVAEIRAGVTEYDSRGVWAMSGGCSPPTACRYPEMRSD